MDPIHQTIVYRLLFVTAFPIFTVDQITKAWIFNTLPLGSYNYPGSIEVIPDFFYIVHIGNEGAAWGMLSGHSGWLVVFALVALAVIYQFRQALDLHRPIMQLAFGMLIGGILGNLTDRLLHGHVIDFLDFHFRLQSPHTGVTPRLMSLTAASSLAPSLFAISMFWSQNATTTPTSKTTNHKNS